MIIERPHRLPLAFAVVAVLASAPALHSARIVLVNGDGPNHGFNSRHPVQPVQGNPATTLGGQRLAAFEAAAREWERILVSPVEIRVLGFWDDLGCSANSATLASAGPLSVFRGGSLPLPDTWYVAAATQGLLQESLLADDEQDVVIFFNDAVDGTAGCLAGTEWDYGVGEGVVADDRISMLDVTRHELAHGLGFTSLVDEITGERFLGFDDSFMVNLEDHSVGRAWPELSNGQRATSATDTGDLHWVGGAVQGRGGVLSSGLAADSAHVEMYAPAVLSLGSSVSHWDTDLGAGSFDELMEPMSEMSMANLVTPALMEDIGWGVAYPRAASVADADGNGVDEIAVVRSDRVSGRLSTVVVDPSTGAAVSRSELLRGYASVDLAVVPSFAGTAADEVAVLARNPSTGAVQVFVTDSGSGEVVSQVGFAPDFEPIALAVVPHFAGSPAAELAVLAIRPSDGVTLVLQKDAQSGQSLKTLAFANGNHPVDLAVLPDVGGGPAPEIAVLVRRPDQGNRGVYIRDANTGTTLHLIQLDATFAASRLAEAGGSVAVVGAEGSAARVVVLDPSTGSQSASFFLSDDLLPLGVTGVADFGGSTAAEVAVMGMQASNRGLRVLVADTSTGEELHRIALPAVRVPLDLVVVSDYSSTPADEVGVLVATETDFRFRVFIDDPGSGLRLAQVSVPTDGEIEAGGVAVEAEGERLVVAPSPDAPSAAPGLRIPGLPDGGRLDRDGLDSERRTEPRIR